MLMSETIEELRDKFLRWKEAFESKGLKDNLWKPRVMVSSGITQDSLVKSKVDLCGVCCWRVKVNSVLCVQCGRWIHGRCAGVKRMTPKILRNFSCRKFEGNIEEAVLQEVELCDELETVSEFTYLGGRLGAVGGCQAAVTARKRCGLVKFRECCELLCGRRFPLKLKGDVYRSYVWPEVLYGSEAWCLQESEMRLLQRTERSMLRVMCGVQLKDRKKSTNLIFLLGLSKTIDQLAMANSVSW